MRILFVSDTYYPHLNGVYYFVCRLAPLLQERGHEVAVIAPSETMNYSVKKIDNITVHGIPSLPVLYYPNVRFPIPLRLKYRLSQIVEKFRPDIIHIQDHFSIASTIVWMNRKLRIPIVGTNHFMTENLTSLIRYKKWREKLSTVLWNKFSNVFNQVELVTTPSETAARLIRPKLKVEVFPISSGIDLQIFNPPGNTDWVREKYKIPTKPVLLFVGRLDPEKNISEILVAVAAALEKVEFCLVIVGKGLEKTALEHLSAQLDMEDKIIFTGFVPDAELPYIYKLSRCFIISSIAELLSLGTLQGMAAGLPIIAVNMGALSELVHDKMNGYLYEAGDTQAIARNICEIISREDLSKKMSIKSLEYVQKHDILETLNSFEKVYQQVCTKRIFKFTPILQPQL